MPSAVIAFDFDPLLRIGDGAVRLETVAVAGAILAGLVVAGLAVARAGLRVDDLVFVVLGIVPGAVVGGRLGYVLIHPDFFLAVPGRILDPGVGSVELTLAVVGGAITGTLVAILLDGRPGPWLHVAALPMLLVTGLAKAGSVLGGSGQGQPTTGEPATAYLGPGPWGSLAPDTPSIPSQALEAIGVTIVIGAVMVLALSPPFRRPDGRLFLVALAAWALVRAIVASTWRDPAVLGPLRAEQVIDLIVAVVALGLLVAPNARRAAGDDRARDGA
ncbi:MAG TPA: prolipoprotein diacylglyceryl transferase family protein [Candidatus Limnocylindrales bacterium]|nr:prolipoprotein diacylglyceryl transferase family protein [Candidatus Limnocylindrales bacterium]